MRRNSDQFTRCRAWAVSIVTAALLLMTAWPFVRQVLAETAAVAAPAPRSLSLAEAQALAVQHDPQIALAELDAREAEIALADLEESQSQGPRFIPPWERFSPYPWSQLQEQYAVAAQQSRLRLATLQKDGAELQVKQGVEQAYLDVLSAEEQLVAAKAAVTAAASQLEVATKGAQAGAISQLDLAQAEQGLKAAEVSAAVAERQLASAVMALNSRIGLDLDTPLVLTTRFTDAALPDIDLTAHVEQALRRRLEMIAAREQTKLAQLFMDNARKSFGEGANLPTYRQAERDLARAQLQEQQQRDAIILQVRQAYLALLNAAAQYESQLGALALAEQAFDVSLIKLQAGLISNTAATEAQVNLTRARSAAAEALYRYNMALAAFHQTAGTDLPEPEPPAEPAA